MVTMIFSVFVQVDLCDVPVFTSSFICPVLQPACSPYGRQAHGQSLQLSQAVPGSVVSPSSLPCFISVTMLSCVNVPS